MSQVGRLNVVIHSATPEQIAEEYDINVVSTQRVNRAALPIMRKQRSGLLLWSSSSSAAGGTPPYLGPYFCREGGHGCPGRRECEELTRWE